MGANQYRTILERWKNDLVVGRARRMGLRGQELLDAQQELVLHVARFRHEPARSNGACEATALTAVVDRRLKAWRRSGWRYTRRLERARAQCVLHGRNCSDSRSDIDERMLALDVREAIARLEPQEQIVCQMLGQGESIAAIAARLGCGWHTVRRIIEHIRLRFEELGVDAWIIDT
jgi:DNA-binding CsgD family transcriptional regulator